MRDLQIVEMGQVVGGENFPVPSREEVERQVQELREFLEDQARRNGVVQH